MPRQISQLGRRWYVIHTTSGCEENVAKNLRQRIETMGMRDKIFNVLVPTEKRIKMKHGKRKIVTEKIFPGYVLVEMIVDDDSWFVVRNTPNVSGFIGAGNMPVPISAQEIKTLQKRMGVEEPKYKIDVSIGEPVKITDGPFKGYEAKISEIDEARGRVKVLVNIFGRETPLELDFLQVRKL
jgi:transcriptional antiterminator NusG